MLSCHSVLVFCTLVVVSGDYAASAAVASEVKMPGYAPGDPGLQRADFSGFPPVSEQIAMCKDESLDQSLAWLNDVNLFFMTGPNNPGSITMEVLSFNSLSEDDEFWTVRVIMGNRRVAKLYEELGTLPQKVAAARINKSIEANLSRYLVVYAGHEWIHTKDHYLLRDKRNSGSSTSTGVEFISHAGRNDETLSGLRYATLSLVWLAGALGLDECHSAVVRVAREAIEQRETVYNDDIHHDAYKRSILKHHALYNRMVLGNALLATAPEATRQFRAENEGVLEQRIYQQDKFDVAPNFRLFPAEPEVDQIDIDYSVGFTDTMIDDLLTMIEGA